MKKSMLLGLGAMLVLGWTAAPAEARGHSRGGISIGIGFSSHGSDISLRYSNYGGYYHYSHRPVYCRPPVVIYSAPVYVPPPVVYYPAPRVYYYDSYYPAESVYISVGTTYYYGR
jgi:hypothetical protein